MHDFIADSNQIKSQLQTYINKYSVHAFDTESEKAEMLKYIIMYKLCAECLTVKELSSNELMLFANSCSELLNDFNIVDYEFKKHFSLCYVLPTQWKDALLNVLKMPADIISQERYNCLQNFLANYVEFVDIFVNAKWRVTDVLGMPSCDDVKDIYYGVAFFWENGAKISRIDEWCVEFSNGAFFLKKELYITAKQAMWRSTNE